MRVLLIFTGWLIAEFLIWRWAVDVFGWLIPLAVTLFCSFCGLRLIRGAGSKAMAAMRTSDGISLSGFDLFGGGLKMLGAILLLVPGLLSDFVGALLLAPAIRQLIAKRVGGTTTPAKDGVVDLEPGEWQRRDERTLGH